MSAYVSRESAYVSTRQHMVSQIPIYLVMRLALCQASRALACVCVCAYMWCYVKRNMSMLKRGMPAASKACGNISMHTAASKARQQLVSKRDVCVCMCVCVHACDAT
jgi:hypothetical protein